MYTFQSSGHFNFTTEMDSSNSLVLNFAFPCGLRGFHVYKELWNPKVNEKLETIHEENNPHDRYAVAAIRKTVSRLRPVVVGHLLGKSQGLQGYKQKFGIPYLNSQKKFQLVKSLKLSDLCCKIYENSLNESVAKYGFFKIAKLT